MKLAASELKEGIEYRVKKEFLDFDGVLHSIGDTWTFKGKNFLPYDDGLSLFVGIKGKEKHIRLQWREEQQLEIIENFSDYVEET
ncbi:MAG: DUF3601 domain-containing protein [Verrucomicrobiota bacterium]